MTATNKTEKTKIRAADYALREPWAIREDALENIIAIADRRIDVEAVEARMGKPLENTRTVSMRGDIAVIPVLGPIFRYANIFTRVSGATSLETLALDFNTALDNPKVSGIVLEIDSPGGMAAGISEFADMVRASSKRVTAYASNNAASAAYWIGAAAKEFYISDTAQLGSIGVISGIRKESDPGVVQFISSQSPKKRLDMEKDDDRGAMQKTIDQMADVFVDKVSKFRDVSRETVLSDFGQGWVLVGEHAVKAGMADGVSSLESVIAGLSGTTATKEAFKMKPEAVKPESTPALTLETLKANHSAIYDQAFAEGATAGSDKERERIQSVESAALPGHEKLISSLKFDGKTTGAEAALEIVKAERENRAQGLQSFGSEAPKPVAQPAKDDLSSNHKADEDDGMSDDDKAKAKWGRDSELRAEFGDDFEAYSAYEKANASGYVKVLKK